MKTDYRNLFESFRNEVESEYKQYKALDPTDQKAHLLSKTHPELFDAVSRDLEAAVMEKEEKILDDPQLSTKEKQALCEKVEKQASSILQRKILSQTQFEQELKTLERIEKRERLRPTLPEDLKSNPRQELMDKLGSKDFKNVPDKIKDVVREFYKSLPEPVPDFTEDEIIRHLGIGKRALGIEEFCEDVISFMDPSEQNEFLEEAKEELHEYFTTCMQDPDQDFNSLADELEENLKNRFKPLEDSDTSDSENK